MFSCLVLSTPLTCPAGARGVRAAVTAYEKGDHFNTRGSDRMGEGSLAAN
jgi:hypothetical protein